MDFSILLPVNTLSAIFDGFRFTNYSAGKRASYTELSYAGQTYNNAPDRIVLIQWLRTQNPERLYTGMLTLPRELELIKQDGEWILAQHPVHEWFDAKKQRTHSSTQLTPHPARQS